MALVSYYKDLFFDGSVGGYIALGLLGVALVIMLLHAVLAYGRGTSRSAMRLITVAVAAVLSFFATRILGRAFLGDAALGDYLPLTVEALQPLLDTKASLVVLPILFVVLYFFFSILLLVVHKLLCGILGFSYKRNNFFTRLFALLVGVAQGALLSIVLFLPILNVCEIYGDAVREGSAQNAAVSVYESFLEATKESPISDFTLKYGGDFLFGEFAKATTSALPES